MDLSWDISEDEGPDPSEVPALVDAAVQVPSESLKAALEANDRSFFADLSERCETSEDAIALLKIVASAANEELDTIAPMLPILAARGWPDVNDKIKELVAGLINFPGSRVVRKAAIAAMRYVVHAEASPSWNDFFVLINALEEPQFHLVQPALPKFDLLLKACWRSVGDGCISPRWIQLLFIKAINHPNGWLRLWAIQKLITVEPQFFENDPSIILTHLLPALNSNDAYSRLIENEELESFVVGLGQFFQRVLSVIDIFKIGAFYKSLLELFTGAWNPCSLYLLSISITHITSYPVFTEQFFPLFRQIFDTVARIQYAPLRLCTSLNFMRLFVSLTCWSDSAIWAFAPLLNGIPSRAFNAVVKRALVEMYADRSQTMMSDYSANTLFDAYLLHCYDDFKNARAYAAITWVLAEVKGVSHMLFNSVCDYIVRDSEISLSFMYLDILLYLWIEGDHKESTASFFGIVSEYLEMRLFALEGTADDFETFNSLYRRLVAVCLREESAWAPCAVSVIEQLVFIREKSKTIEDSVRGYLKRNLFRPSPETSRGVKAHEPHERFVSEALMVNRLQLLLRFPWSVDLPAEEILRACVDELHGSFSWEHRCALLNVINTFLPQVQTSEKGIEVIEALVVVAEEERNSHNHLPAVNALLKACLHERMLAMDAIAKKSLSVVNKLMEQAAQNVELAFAICEALERTVEQLDAEWIPVLVDLCSYGPVPKKDTRVLHYAYEMAYSSKISPLLSDSPADQLHYIVQRIRIRALLLTRRVCARSGVLAAAIMKRLIDVSTLLDKAHSKSFGLSLSHRRKTRLMQLALLILDTVDEASLCELVEHCKQCVVNTAQQFSIKLFVEYILVRIYFRHQNLFNRFIDSQKELGAVRVGSITSWINVIMQVVKAKNSPELIERCLILFLPWCTAQNFSVRCTAIAAIKCLWPIADEKMHQKLEYLRAIIDFDMEASGNSKRIIDNLCNDFYFAHFHAEDHFSLQTILKTFPEKTGLPSEEVIPIHIFAECSNDCPIKQRCNDEKFNEAPSLVYSGLSKTTNHQIIPTTPGGGPSEQFEDPLQRKLDVVKGKWRRPEGTSLIVIASLIDKSANLGGLCRTSEIFGAEKLIVADAGVVNDQNFKALSLSSENWITIEQVRVTELLDYLKSKRKEGYTIVAAEQTTNSVPFASFRFPPKSVILLGDEKEGVPVEYIRCVDESVEIAQVGQTRSLNVHVTGALFIHKYAENNYLTS